MLAAAAEAAAPSSEPAVPSRHGRRRCAHSAAHTLRVSERPPRRCPTSRGRRGRSRRPRRSCRSALCLAALPGGRRRRPRGGRARSVNWLCVHTHTPTRGTAPWSHVTQKTSPKRLRLLLTIMPVRAKAVGHASPLHPST
eukprot:7377318-Prymnesium_polylepis.1